MNEKQGTRLSINGWFHGPVNVRPIPTVESLPVMKSATKFQSNDVRSRFLFEKRFIFN